MATESFLSRDVMGHNHPQRISSQRSRTGPQSYSEIQPCDTYPKEHRHTAPDYAMRSHSSDVLQPWATGGGGVSHHYVDSKSSDHLYSQEQPKSFPQVNPPLETKFSPLGPYDTKASVSTSVDVRGQNIGTSVDLHDGHSTPNRASSDLGDGYDHSTHSTSVQGSGDLHGGYGHNTQSTFGTSVRGSPHDVQEQVVSSTPYSPRQQPQSVPGGAVHQQQPQSHPSVPGGAVHQQPWSHPSVPAGAVHQQQPQSHPSVPAGAVHQQQPKSHPSVPGGAVRMTQDPTHHKMAINTQTRSQSENTMGVPGCAYYKPVRPSISQTTLSVGSTSAPSSLAAPSPSSSSFSSRPPGRTLSASHATLENERYSLDSVYSPDHPNEDRHFSLENPNFKVFAVFDGHDGPRAAGFASNYMRQLFDTPSWTSVVERNNPDLIREALGEFFKATEKEFFASIQCFIDEKEILQSRIPKHLSSYAAYQQYPDEVKRLQEVEPRLTGGCTAVLAVVVNGALYVANVGDSRAVLVTEGPGHHHTFSVDQLSMDHGVENEEELRRLERVGLDPKQLIKSGRLGMHENVRSIGDHSIKGGYKDVDTLRNAHSAPGTAVPYIMPIRKIDHTFKYLLLMTDGVYKSVESTLDQQLRVDSNKVVVTIMERHLALNEFDFVADNVLGRISKIHSDCYEANARKDPRSPMAVSCRKRDDMTLLVYKFPDSRLE